MNDKQQKNLNCSLFPVVASKFRAPETWSPVQTVLQKKKTPHRWL